MALNNQYGNQLARMMQPGGFQGSEAYQFNRDQGLQATQRGMSSQRGSGNALAALQSRGAGIASQDYGSEFDRLSKAHGQEQQYDATTTRNANDFSLGQTRNSNDFSLGQTRNDNDRRNNDNNFQLGQGQLARGNQSDYWNYELGRGRNANDESRNRNDFNQQQYRSTGSGGYGGGGGGYGFQVGSNFRT